MRTGIWFSFIILALLLSCKQQGPVTTHNDTEMRVRSEDDEIEAGENTDGQEEEDELEINISDIPQPIVNAIAQKYPGATIREADKITQSDTAFFYDVEITFRDKVIEVMYEADGRSLGEETEDD